MSFIAHGISIVVLCAVSVGAAGAEPEAGQVSFENDVKPIFEKKCFRCHNDKNRKADLDLHSIDHILKGGESGSAIDFAKPEKGLLYEYIHEGMMPPEDEPPLTEAERANILSWVK